MQIMLLFYVDIIFTHDVEYYWPILYFCHGMTQTKASFVGDLSSMPRTGVSQRKFNLFAVGDSNEILDIAYL